MKKTKIIKPIHIVLFMLSCFGALALVCLIMPTESQWAGNSIRTPLLSEVLELEQDSIEEDMALAEDTVFVSEIEVREDQQISEIKEEVTEAAKKPAGEIVAEAVTEVVTETLSTPTPSAPQAVVSENFDTTDTRIYLTAFYSALKRAKTEAIRVVHYGDSQIEEDRLTTQLRRALQRQYGGGGVGLIPLHQTIPTSTVWQSIQINGRNQQINQGPKRYLVYGPKSMRRSNSLYGPMGQVALMDNNLVAGSENIIMQINGAGKNKNIESYFNRIRIVQSGDVTVSIERATGRQGDVFNVPDSTSSATIHFQGKGEIYGISLEKDKGVMVDNIPMRGSSGAVFTSIAPNEMQNYFLATNTRLIIMQFGGNIMPYTTTRQQVAQYIDKMQTQIQYIKYLAPESSIVFVGPSDMSERRDGKLQTYKMIPVMDKALQQMAIEEDIGYFSLYQHMGGQGSMIAWKERGWAGGDYVHFTRKGADKAGEMLAQWLLQASKL